MVAASERCPIAVYANRNAGFTLVDAMMTLAVVAILTTTAVPSMHSVIAENRLATQVNQVVGTLNLARSEAVKRGQRVIMCRSSNALDCERTSGWQEGWIVFADNNGNREHDAAETIIRVQGPLQRGTTITSGARRRIVFQPLGTSGGTNATFTFCDVGAVAKPRAVILSNTGRARFSHTGPGNRPLNCS